jgi:hypothetical protein
VVMATWAEIGAAVGKREPPVAPADHAVRTLDGQCWRVSPVRGGPGSMGLTAVPLYWTFIPP